MTAEAHLNRLLDSLRDRAPDESVEQARADIGYGEYGMALENICEGLFEHDCVLEPESIDEIERLATQLGLADERWKFVESLVELPRF